MEEKPNNPYLPMIWYYNQKTLKPVGKSLKSHKYVQQSHRIQINVQKSVTF
jgi:hypothetical protein